LASIIKISAGIIKISFLGNLCYTNFQNIFYQNQNFCVAKKGNDRHIRLIPTKIWQN